MRIGKAQVTGLIINYNDSLQVIWVTKDDGVGCVNFQDGYSSTALPRGLQGGRFFFCAWTVSQKPLYIRRLLPRLQSLSRSKGYHQGSKRDLIATPSSAQSSSKSSRSSGVFPSSFFTLVLAPASSSVLTQSSQPPVAA